ncbi:MAG: hypothetical protein FJ009_17165 [Chloroflexi bacterium]|nr:hypothetical protein [Chloroflexota bacterium]
MELATSYRFFDLHVLLRSDSPAILEHFRQVYERFQVDGASEPAILRLPLQLRSGHGAGQVVCQIFTEREESPPNLILDGQVHVINQRHLLLDYAHTVLLNAVFARVDDHFLIHGASLSWSAGDRARGLILAGGAGLGKTTLALALTQRGLRFLSDDVVALNCADGLLHPFPRRLGLRPETWQLCDLGSTPPTRQWVDATTLCGDCLGAPCAPSVLILLDDGQRRTERPCDVRLALTLDRLPAGLERDLGRLGKIDAVTRASPSGYATLLFQPSVGNRVSEEDIQRICASHATLLLDVDKASPLVPPDFTASPQLVSISPSIAALTILARLRGGERSALLQRTFGGSPARLYTALAAMIGGMKCYRLTVGRLEKMIDLIESVTRFR